MGLFASSSQTLNLSEGRFSARFYHSKVDYHRESEVPNWWLCRLSSPRSRQASYLPPTAPNPGSSQQSLEGMEGTVVGDFYGYNGITVAIASVSKDIGPL